MRPRELFSLTKRTTEAWLDDNAPSRAASLSYYTVFSIAPILLIAVAIAGFVFGRDAVSGQLQLQLRDVVGDSGGRAISDMMVSAGHMGRGIFASIIGVAILLVGATGAFVELQDSLNAMWKVQKKPRSGVVAFVRARLLSFAMVAVIAFLLLVSLVVSAALAALGAFARDRIPAGEVWLHGLNLVVSFGVITMLFAALYKVLPDADVAWKDVWLGAAVTAFLFSVGKLGIGLYLGKSSVSSSYGAAGSFAVLLIWIYYSAMIFLLGAEFTRVYAEAHGSLSPSAGKVAQKKYPTDCCLKPVTR